MQEIHTRTAYLHGFLPPMAHFYPKGRVFPVDLFQELDFRSVMIDRSSVTVPQLQPLS